MSTATEMLAQYMAAEMAVLKGQSFTFNGRSLTRANLPEIQSGRREWESRVAAERPSIAGGDSRFAVADFVGRGLHE